MCLDGARWVQENILDKPENDRLSVTVIWEPMMEKTDKRSAWSPEVITDPRARQFWDEERVAGRWLAGNAKSVRSLGDIAWDCFYAYPAGEKWDAAAARPLAGGTPVFLKTAELGEAVTTLLGAS